MKNMFGTPPGRNRMIRWGAGITIAGFVAGGAFAAVTATGNAAPASSANAQASGNNTELNTLLSTASTNTGVRRDVLARLRGIGGYYGSLTFKAKDGVRTVAFERGTIQTVTSSNVVVRAPDGTTMTWLIVSDTVVRDHGKATTSALSDGQLVFVGGPVVSGARDARLIYVRTGEASGSNGAKKAPASELAQLRIQSWAPLRAPARWEARWSIRWRHA
jgi:hypothetical protein